jgi:hypothetical protein
MRRYEIKQVTVSRSTCVESKCDGCGILEAEAEWGRLLPVVIEIDMGEEGGSRDQYDYCDPCLIERADILRAAGSTSRLVAE